MQLVDVMVWVVDPQKYADAVLHERYLRPLVEHAPVMVVVLNQIDRLPPAEREACLRDLRRLLDSEGLEKTTIRAVSAETGEGLPELRELIAARVADKLAAARRLAADVSTAADRLASASGDAETPELTRRSLDTMNTAMAEAAGARVVGDAVRDAWRVRGAAATGWPVVAWIGRLKPDPLRRLHLDRLSVGSKGQPKEIDPTGVGRTSLPTRSGVQQARVDTAVRDLAAEASGGLTRGWTDAVKIAARSQESRLPDALDRAVARTDLDVDRRRRWWQVVRVLQWILLAAVVAGLLWLAASFVLAYLQLPPLPPVTWGRLPAPTVLVLGGVLAGLLLARTQPDRGGRRGVAPRAGGPGGAAPIRHGGHRRAGGPAGPRRAGPLRPRPGRADPRHRPLTPPRLLCRGHRLFRFSLQKSTCRTLSPRLA